ncbi:MAG TPA: DUF393 domain-containing protein [Clostridia bacterium]|nr:DUF393 domain-containing protein [Clostridia bacterium]
MKSTGTEIVGPRPKRFLGWILYDGSCGFCSKWVQYWESTLTRHGFKIVPLQESWVRERLRLSEAELLSDLRVLRADGGQNIGADGYRYILKHIPWAYPIFLLSCVPGLRWIFDWAYRQFARHRFAFSHTCGLRPRLHDKPAH